MKNYYSMPPQTLLDTDQAPLAVPAVSGGNKRFLLAGIKHLSGRMSG